MSVIRSQITILDVDALFLLHCLLDEVLKKISTNQSRKNLKC